MKSLSECGQQAKQRQRRWMQMAYNINVQSRRMACSHALEINGIDKPMEKLPCLTDLQKTCSHGVTQLCRNQWYHAKTCCSCAARLDYIPTTMALKNAQAKMIANQHCCCTHQLGQQKAGLMQAHMEATQKTLNQVQADQHNGFEMVSVSMGSMTQAIQSLVGDHKSNMKKVAEAMQQLTCEVEILTWSHKKQPAITNNNVPTAVPSTSSNSTVPPLAPTSAMLRSNSTEKCSSNPSDDGWLHVAHCANGK